MAERPEQVPVLLVRTGEHELAAISDAEAPQQWGVLPRKLAQGLAGALATSRRSSAAQTGGRVSIRLFEMDPSDIHAWDSMTRHGKGGFSYATLWGHDGKIGAQAKIREVQQHQGQVRRSSNPTAPVDAAAIANAVAMAQLQAAIEHLSEQISELRLDVVAVIRFLRLEQEAEVLAAVETVDEVYRQSRVTGVVGGVGWDRIVELEQPMQRLHRQIIGELQSVTQLARYTTIEQAKEVLRVDTERVDHLIALEQHILTALSRWTELMLLARLERDELHPSAAQYARDRLLRRVQEAHAAIRDLATADGGQVHGRSLWDRLRSDGLIGGALKDDKTREDAKVIRHKLHNVASGHQRFDLESASRPRLELVA